MQLKMSTSVCESVTLKDNSKCKPLYPFRELFTTYHLKLLTLKCQL